MKTFTRIVMLLVFLYVGNQQVLSQSCAITRVPSSASLPKEGGTTYVFSIILYGNCTPIFTKSASWLSYTYQPSDNTHGLLWITATANTGTARTGYVYVDNKESLKITIYQAGTTVGVTGVTVSPSSTSINAGAYTYLSATVYPTNATNKSLIWYSSNSTVASVDSYGKVTGLCGGTATITARTVDGGFSASSTVTVIGSPSSFSWGSYLTPVKDQLTGDPCFLFASVAAVEAKFNIQNNSYSNIDLAEGQLNLSCLNEPLGIEPALRFIRDHSIYDESCYPYSESVYGGGSYPYPDCYAPCGDDYGMKVTIYYYNSINLASVPSAQRTEYFRNAIQNNGPIAVSFGGTSLHNGAMHAYLIYGWNGSYWLYKDSWQGQSGLYQTSVNIPEVLATNAGVANYVAYSVGTVYAIYGSGGNSGEVPEIGNESLALGINATQMKDIELYPNPANTEITILNVPAGPASVSIFTSGGTLLSKQNLVSPVLDISSLEGGLYFIKISMDSQTTVLKFVKQ